MTSERGLRTQAVQPATALIAAATQGTKAPSGELARLDQISGEQTFLSFP